MWTKKAAGHLTAGILGLVLALVTGSLGLAVVGLLFLTSVVVGYLAQRRVRIRHSRTLSADRLREKDHMLVKGKIEGAGLGTGFVEVRDRLDKRVEVVAGSNYRIVNLPRGKQKDFDYELRLPIRGVYGVGPIEVRKTDMYELFYDKHEIANSVDGVTVLPFMDDIRDAELRSLFPKIVTGASSVRTPGIGSDFYALREYTPSDPMRDVNWKASARKGELIVNQWQHETIKMVTLIFDARASVSSGALGANPMVYNARAAATIAEYFLQERSTLQFVEYGDAVRTIAPDTGDRQLYKILERLATIEPRGSMAFREVAEHVLPTLKARVPVVVFTNLEDDPTFYDGMSTLLARGVRILVVAPSSPDFLRMADESPISAKEYEVRRVRHQMQVKRLRGLGCRVALWEPDDRLALALMAGLAQ